jgi:hypothetical protein
VRYLPTTATPNSSSVPTKAKKGSRLGFLDGVEAELAAEQHRHRQASARPSIEFKGEAKDANDVRF